LILVTGVAGFIGKHLLKALIKEYGSTSILAFSSSHVEGCAYLLHNKYSFNRNYFINSGYSTIHTIVHAGAFTPKNRFQANDWSNCTTNIKNTEKLLEADLPDLRKLIFLSTLDVYGKDKVISEQSPVDPVSLYGDSKLYCEKMISSWARVNDIVYQVLRIGHVYGPGEESYQKIIPETFRRLLANKSPQMWGSGTEIRSFIYIKDIVRAILNSIRLNESIGPINLVGGSQITIRDLISKMILISGRELSIETLPSNDFTRNLIFDNKKMRDLLLPSETSLDQGLKEEWGNMKNIVS
jgi:nucleoside-diphosphate-sugar epimerase